MTRRLLLVVLAVIAPLGLVACGGGGGGSSEPTKAAVDGKITIDALDSFHFSIGTITTTAGPLTVTLVNKGAIPHSFKIEGTDMTLSTNGGKSATGTVTLKAGTYKFECTVPGHAAQGMKGTVVVS